MILNGFNISCSLGKQSNNVSYGFSFMKCATSGIFPVSRHEQKCLFFFFLNQLVATNLRIVTDLKYVVVFLDGKIWFYKCNKHGFCRKKCYQIAHLGS